MTQYEISAIIGHWRNGASLLEISLVTGYSNFEIEKVIKNHERKQTYPKQVQRGLSYAWNRSR